MTKEEIDAMEAGPKLDELIAEKVMGLKPPFGARPYSTDIGAAWLVVEKIGLFKTCDITQDEDGRWWIDCSDGWRSASTAPLAICRTALMIINNEAKTHVDPSLSPSKQAVIDSALNEVEAKTDRAGELLGAVVGERGER